MTKTNKINEKESGHQSERNKINEKESGHQSERNKILKKDSETALYEAIAHCKTEAEHRAFLADLCTPQEITALAERWVIARLLNAQSDSDTISYRDISRATGASTTTVGRVARFLTKEPHKGYRVVLERIRKEEDNETTMQPTTKPPP